jgi:hypothetical protein
VANPPRAKGTGGEREVLRRFRDAGVPVFRSPASATVDLYREADGDPLHLLATRPDGGGWLVSLPLDELITLVGERPLQIEVKRYRRFKHHTLYESKFGRR